MNDINDTSMTLGEHIEDLRGYLIRALLGAAGGMILCLIFGKYIMQIMCWPAAVAMRVRGEDINLQAIAPAEAFITYLKVCLIWGLILAGPFVLWQIWKFVAPGLFKHEKKYVNRYLPFSVGLFILGVTFFFIVIAPIGLHFFLGFGSDQFPMPKAVNPLVEGWADDLPIIGESDSSAESPKPLSIPALADDPTDPPDSSLWINTTDGSIRYAIDGEVTVIARAPRSFLKTQLRLSSYMTFVSWLSLVFGMGFQIPIVVLVLAKSGAVSLARMKSARKYVIVGLLVIAAVLTPPDVVTQVCLAVPMYLLFELGLLLAGRGEKDAAEELTEPQG